MICVVCGCTRREVSVVCHACRNKMDAVTIEQLEARQEAKVTSLTEARKNMGTGALADLLIRKWLR